MRPPPHPREEERLAALRSYRILDTESDELYDAIVRVAAAICKTPISLITLIDDERQWFKAKVGIELSETDRASSFCAHAILEEGPMMCGDTTQDSRFADNVMVTQDPGIRFYAGAPLCGEDGLPLGTVCVADYRPRELSPEQLEALAMLSRSVGVLLELQRSGHRPIGRMEGRDEVLAGLERLSTLFENLPPNEASLT